MSAYVVAMFSSVAVVVTHALEPTTSFEAAYIVFALCIFTCTTVTLCLLFVPKVSMLNCVPGSKFFVDVKERNNGLKIFVGFLVLICLYLSDVNENTLNG